jgi:hypothetical protein
VVARVDPRLPREGGTPQKQGVGGVSSNCQRRRFGVRPPVEILGRPSAHNRTRALRIRCDGWPRAAVPARVVHNDDPMR